MRYNFEYKITPFRKYIEDLEDKARNLYDTIEESLKYQAELVIMELLENAEKYGKVNGDQYQISLKFSADETQIEITVSNYLNDIDNLKKLESRLKKIRESDDLEALYTNRLIELANNPNLLESGLGLYRIAYEGGFSLSCEFKDQMVIVYALKKL